MATLPQMRWYIGFSGPTTGTVFTVGDATLGQVGVVPIGAADTWVEITDWVRSWTLRYGASAGDNPTLRFDAATATLELNDGDRRFDPDNLLGPYVSAGRSQVEPMRRVKGTATWNGTPYPMYYGLTDDVQPTYIDNSWTTVTLTATDPSKVLADLDRGPVAPVGAGEDSGARVTRILNAAGWSAAARVIAAGDTTLQSTDLNGNALTELQLVQDTEQGEFYFDRQGRAVFRNRKAILEQPRSTVSQATFGDDPAGYPVSGELPYADAKMSSPDSTLVNAVTASRAGGTEQLAEDVTSIGRYLKKPHTRNDLLQQADAEVLNWAEALLYQYKDPARRFARLEFNVPAPDVEGALWPALLGREIGDRITVLRRPAGGGDPIERDCFVRGLEFSSDGEDWRSAIVLQSAERYSFFVVGDPILGRVGLNAVTY